MSVGPTSGMIGSAAGSPLAQTTGSDVERAQQDASSQARQTQTEKTAENATGIGQTEEDQQSSERDADGRRVLEKPAEKGGQHASDSSQEDPPKSNDPTGESGTLLDLIG